MPDHDLCVGACPPGERFDPGDLPQAFDVRSVSPEELASASEVYAFYEQWQGWDRETTWWNVLQRYGPRTARSASTTLRRSYSSRCPRS